MPLVSLASRTFGQSEGPVKVALIAPLSGPWARSGELMRFGAQKAILDINNSGGIAALNGRQMELVVYDAGDSVERAANAAQRMVAQDPDVVAGNGAWLTSFTLGVTEVTERAGIPWLTLSWLDAITERGFRHVFATSAPTSELVDQSVPSIVSLYKDAGRDIKKVALINDGTTPARGFMDLITAETLPGLEIEVLSDQTFTSPLSDATPLVQRIRSARPDLLILYATNLPDIKLVIEKMSEFGLSKTIPIFVPTQAPLVPEVLNTIDSSIVDGVIGLTSNWPTSEIADQIEEFKAFAGEPWITADFLSPYGEFMLIRDAIERAGSADRKAIADALYETPSDSPATKYFSGTGFGFNEKGRRVNGPAVLVQWQNGEPQAVYPIEGAQASLQLPSS